MTGRPFRPASFLGTLWRTDQVLTASGLGLLGLLLPFTLADLALDPRIIAGAPAWLKPAKFAASTGVYCLTLAWVFGYLPDWPRLRRVVSTSTVAIFFLEVGIIGLQAFRGTTSHFNVATTLDATLFGIMGMAIVVQTAMSTLVAVALWKQPVDDRPMAWALRAGIVIAILGASTGGLMTRPTLAQLEEAERTQRMTVAGAHTVGAPDGGPGLPGTGWSLHHGDIRVAHFVGLHALQALPLLAWMLTLTRHSEGVRTRLLVAAASSYVSLFGLLLAQALRGQSVVEPDRLMLTLLASWLAASALAGWLVTRWSTHDNTRAYATQAR
ncbi:MAG: hypothetical protein AB7I50_16135 [Vicinamibacterales bacterium]